MSNEHNIKKKNKVYSKNISKRGNVSKSLGKKKKGMPIGYCAGALLVFVLVGSALFQFFKIGA